MVREGPTADQHRIRREVMYPYPRSAFSRFAKWRVNRTEGAYAARPALSGDSVGMANTGYQRWKTLASSWLSTLVRTWSSRCALSGAHRICCFLTIRLLTTWLTVDSTNALEIASPAR